jgi:hypothetical protein
LPRHQRRGRPRQNWNRTSHCAHGKGWLSTEHAAIRGFNYFQRVEPYYSNFTRFIEELSKDAAFRTYPLCTHLTNSWLGGNLRLANQMSQSERELRRELMRAYYQQQLDWQVGVINLMNHVSFRSKSDRAGLASLTGREFERLLNLDGVAFHQMHSCNSTLTCFKGC